MASLEELKRKLQKDSWSDRRDAVRALGRVKVIVDQDVEGRPRFGTSDRWGNSIPLTGDCVEVARG